MVAFFQQAHKYRASQGVIISTFVVPLTALQLDRSHVTGSTVFPAMKEIHFFSAQVILIIVVFYAWVRSNRLTM